MLINILMLILVILYAFVFLKYQKMYLRIDSILFENTDYCTIKETKKIFKKRGAAIIIIICQFYLNFDNKLLSGVFKDKGMFLKIFGDLEEIIVYFSSSL